MKKMIKKPVQDNPIGASFALYKRQLPQGTYSAWSPFVQAASALTADLNAVVEAFWGVPIQLVLVGLSEQAQYFWRMDDFHVSQLQLGKAAENRLPVFLRLSEGLCNTLLTAVLGNKPSAGSFFSLKQLSPLEANMLNEFSRDLLIACKKQLRASEAPNTDTTVFHLLWAAGLDANVLQKRPLPFQNPVEAVQFWDNLETGKLILSVPASALRVEEQHLAGDPGATLTTEFFDHIQVPATIYVGSTKVALADLHGLEVDDLIVLEQSQKSEMALRHAECPEPLFFNVRLEDEDRLTMPYMQEFDEMDSQIQDRGNREQLWDNLMIEVGAEFEPVKLPLKQLRQMSEGLVVEMGDLVNNRICLQVEGKTLAWGELIIVGEKFGVRVTQVVDDTQTAPSSPNGAKQLVAVSQPPDAADEQTNELAEEENLDTLSNDDFDESFDEDDEEW